uniref:FI21286p1 n=1 Tax=Drosophila melanogaster TaxID=7227 RepID=T2FF90_DROME|nr:FI21286p1 [Drosophila melanogaster]
MSGRRCVICGEEPPAKDAKGNEAYAYPKTEEEARIWQSSMAAKNCCLESIQNQCCVCVEHIPDFVKRAKKIGKRLRHLEREKEKRRHEKKDGEGCKCPDDGKPGRERPSVNVLLLNGASLPTYCGKGQSCVDLRPLPAEEGDSELKITKRLDSKESDTEVFVQESEFKDTGSNFPDIDGTEVTVLRTPMQEDEQLEEEMQALQEAEQEQDPSVRRRRNNCLPGCTDVLLLGRGHHTTDECPCKCEQCSKPSGLPQDEPGCYPECCPKSHTDYFTQPPCGCECEQQVRRELTKVIKTQGQRIRELEEILCRQNNLRNCLQRKLDELYCEFGRLDEDEGDRTRLTCPGNQRGGPDCAGVLHPAPTPPSPEPMLQLPPKRRLSYRRSVLRKVNREVDLVETEAERTELDEDGDRVHWLAEKRTQSEKFTRRPVWINEPREEVMESESRMAIRFGKNSTYVVPDKSNHSNLSYSISDSSHSLHNRART